ncbi:MAG: hypothetical protein VB875_13895 [Pirellulales bacterium]
MAEIDQRQEPHKGTGTEGSLPYSLLLELTVQDADTIRMLMAHADGESREQFALNALRIGVLALRQARGEFDAAQVRRESERLLEQLHGTLDQHSAAINERLMRTLKEYFDPSGGRFHERIERLVKKDGELEVLLRRQIGGQDSELCTTLTSHFGEDSQLMKMLSPDQSKGLLFSLRTTLDEQLNQQSEKVLQQFSLDNKEGALARFIGELTDRQGQLLEKLHGKINDVVKEFSLDQEDSALSRLVRNVDRAQKTITSEFSLDDERSALSRLKNLLEATNNSIDSHLSLDDENSALARLRRELLKLHDDQRETNQKFQTEVKTTLQAMVARREEADRSTRHGLEFEDAVFQFLQHESNRAGDVATHTGNTTGLIKNCKIGDCVIELGPDSAADGAKVAAEAKEKVGYDLAKARDEIETARKNRCAQVGLFVFSKRAAPAGVEPLSRFGHDVFAVWDSEDADTDIYLRVGMTLARALCVRKHNHQQTEAADFTAIDAAILEIEKRLRDFDQLRTWTKTIYSNSEKILDQLRGVRKSLERQIETLRDKTGELKSLVNDPAG